jgi:RNA polymerase sigma-70 factor, ECF subfamily
MATNDPFGDSRRRPVSPLGGTPGWPAAVLPTDLGDLSQADAARRVGLSAPGMRSRVQRGRSQLREALARCCRVELDAAAQIDRVERVGPCACSP